MMDLTNSNIISADNFANVMGVSKATLLKWEENGTYVPHTSADGKKFFFIKELMDVPEIAGMAHSRWTEELATTLRTIRSAIKELGYTLIEPQVLKAIFYMVPQKRERLILIAIRNDYADKVHFEWPSPYKRILTLKDAFYKGELYDTDVPPSSRQSYPEKKRRVLEMVPQGGDWRDLPVKIQKEYMGASFYLGGGKTGMARRLSMDEPSLTLTCAPAQKQTERCHPLETRPLTIREYARIQTLPDDWHFAGNLSAQYKQIGNAVPVNLAWALGRALIRLMNAIEHIDHGKEDTIPDIRSNVTHSYTREREITQLSLFDSMKLT